MTKSAVSTDIQASSGRSVEPIKTSLMVRGALSLSLRTLLVQSVSHFQVAEPSLEVDDDRDDDRSKSDCFQ